MYCVPNTLAVDRLVVHIEKSENKNLRLGSIWKPEHVYVDYVSCPLVTVHSKNYSKPVATRLWTCSLVVINLIHPCPSAGSGVTAASITCFRKQQIYNLLVLMMNRSGYKGFDTSVGRQLICAIQTWIREKYGIT